MCRAMAFGVGAPPLLGGSAARGRGGALSLSFFSDSRGELADLSLNRPAICATFSVLGPHWVPRCRSRRFEDVRMSPWGRDKFERRGAQFLLEPPHQRWGDDAVTRLGDLYATLDEV